MSLTDRLIHTMVEYEAGVPHRVQHFLKVFEFATLIGHAEELDEDTLLTLQLAAIVHDCGIKPSLIKYKSSGGEYQQLEGPAVARAMLEALDLEEERIERICYLVGHHHTYANINGLDYQILVEADFLVNILESNESMPQIVHVRGNIFRTDYGKWLLDQMYLKKSQFG